MSRKKHPPAPYFRVNPYDWLEYTPWRKHELPSLVHVQDEEGEDVVGKIIRPNTKKVLHEGHVFKLAWAGELDRDVDLPGEITRKWPGITPTTKIPIFLGDWLKEGMLPEDLPDSIAYHLAVNRRRYSRQKGYLAYRSPLSPSSENTIFPIAGLPAKRVDQVLDAVFLPDDTALTAARYLKWVAETHWGHPMLSGFDTSVRDELLGIATEATRAYFFIIGDYQYDLDTQYYNRHGDGRFWWAKLATYLFWVGHTGAGLYADHAGFPYPNTREVEMFEKELPDVVEGLRKWSGDPMWRARDNAHTKSDPCQGVTKEDMSRGPTPGEFVAADKYLGDNLGRIITNAVLSGQNTMVVYEGHDQDLAYAIVGRLRTASYPASYTVNKPRGGHPVVTVTLTFLQSISS